MTRKRSPDPGARFSAEARGRRTNFVLEFFSFLRETRKWWLTPIVLVLILIGSLVILGGGGLAPFIYTLF